jgi:hypothetical protein
MYDLVYEQMDQAGVLEDLEDVWMNLWRERSSVPRQNHLVKVSKILQHPNTFCLLIGNNTNMN